MITKVKLRCLFNKEDLISKINKLNIMKMKSALITLCLLASIVIISGCTIGGGDGTQGTDGISIKDFAFDYSPIYAQDQIGLSLELQNVGGQTGTVNKITLFGADINQGCPTTNVLQWCTNDQITQTPSNEDLIPPDTSTGMEGETAFYTWTLTAPKSVQAPTSYDFQLRTDYSYKTVYTGTLQLVSEDYLRTLPSDQRDTLVKTGGITGSSVTGGPMSIVAASGRHFIVRSGAQDQRKIKFKVTNVGSGFPYNGVASGDTLYQIRITNPIGFDSLNGISTCDATVPLSRGKTGIFECKFTPSASITNKLDKQVQFTLEYEYYTDSVTSVTVNPVIE
jgi:hypothetical protein